MPNDLMAQAQHDYLGPGWERYFKFLNSADRLAPQSPGRTSLGALSRPGDADSARSIAANLAIGQELDARAPRAASLRALTAGADIAEAQARQVQGAEQDQEALDRALQTGGRPAAPIVQQPGGGYIAAPDPNAPPTISAEQRANVLKMVPGHVGLMLQKQWATQDAAAASAQATTAKQSEVERHNRATEAVAPTTTPEGIELAARNYLTTGQMPPLGMGDKTTRQAILNKAAELGGASASISANKADYKADSGSLTAMQKQRDAIGAFEETAGKNIDIFLNTAGKIVDSGSPLANKYLRDVTGKVLGSPNQAAYDAARQVAVNEIAKITSNPNLSGQLSDSARHEVDAFNPREATLAQTVAVMRLLKQDMGNRITSLDDSLKNIKGRLAGPDGGKAKDPLGIR